jgi:hypothetical protein
LLRTCLAANFCFWRVLLKGLLANERNFPNPLMRLARRDVRDHVV